MLMNEANAAILLNVLTGVWLSPTKRRFQMRYFSKPSAAIVMPVSPLPRLSRLLVAAMMLFTAASVFMSRAEAADLFTQNKLNATQQSKIARAVAQTRQLRSDGNMQTIQNNAMGQANAKNMSSNGNGNNNANTRSNDRSCNNNAANVEVAKGHRGKIENLTVVKGDVIMVCRSR
jgi:hypothetical protein